MPDFKLVDLPQTGLGQEEGKDHDIPVEERLGTKPRTGIYSVGVRSRLNLTGIPF